MDAEVNVAPFVELVAKHMYVLDTHSREFLVSWVMVLQAVSPGGHAWACARARARVCVRVRAGVCVCKQLYVA
jgi:hypothetical protein